MAVHLAPNDHWQELAFLWRDLAAVALADVENGWKVTINRLAELMDASGGSVGLTRDNGGDDPATRFTAKCLCGVGPKGRLTEKLVRQYLKHENLADDPMSQYFGVGAGSNRVVRYRGDATPQWHQSPWYELMDRLDLEDRMAGVVVVDEYTEVMLVIDRPRGAKPFSEEEAELYLAAIAGLHPMAAALIGSHGYFRGQTELTPREREVLGYLLGPLPEKQIADEIGLATSSTHQIVVSIYRKLGVSSRPELMSKWLRDCTYDLSARNSRG